MTNAYEETKRLARGDTAIEIMAAMRGTRISQLALEKEKPDGVRDDKLIARLEHELEILRKERDLMNRGDKDIEEKVLTDYSKEIGTDIIEKMDVSVTYIDAEGGYSGQKKRIVYCVISRLQVQKLKEIAKNIDPRAFIAIENVYEVEGVRVKKRKI